MATTTTETTAPAGDRTCMGCASEPTPLGRLWCGKCLAGRLDYLPDGWHVLPMRGGFVPLRDGRTVEICGRAATFATEREAVQFARAEMGRAIRAQHLPARVGY